MQFQVRSWKVRNNTTEGFLSEHATGGFEKIKVYTGVGLSFMFRSISDKISDKYACRFNGKRYTIAECDEQTRSNVRRFYAEHIKDNVIVIKRMSQDKWRYLGRYVRSFNSRH